MAEITLTIPTPKKWWHVLLLPVSIPIYVAATAMSVPILWLVAWANGEA